MGSVRIVTRHEFRTAITRLSYIITTAAVPVLVALGVAVFAIFTFVTREDAESEAVSGVERSADLPRLGYVDLTNGPALFGGHQEQSGAVFVPVSDRDGGVAALANEEIDALFVFPADLCRNGNGGAGPGGRGRRRRRSGRMGLHTAAALRGFVLSNLFADGGSGRVGRASTFALPAGDGGDPARWRRRG